jgi:hypothetical protein
MWQARFYEALPELMQQYPTAYWRLLTLTVRNCPIEELGPTLTAMNLAWQRLLKRPEFRHVKGWVRAVEVTRGTDGSAHPHFHCLLMVPPKMATGKSYVTKERWMELWRSCMRLDYDPWVWIQAVKKLGQKDGAATGPGDTTAIRGAVQEVLKYSTKPTDMVNDPQWFLELTRQVHKRRFIATGGLLKNVLRVDDEESDEELALLDSTEEQLGRERIPFDWRRPERVYRRTKYEGSIRRPKKLKVLPPPD